MFLNVITGYFSTFKVIQGHIFGSRSNKFSKMCVLLYTIDMPNIKRQLQRLLKYHWKGHFVITGCNLLTIQFYFTFCIVKDTDYNS